MTILPGLLFYCMKFFLFHKLVQTIIHLKVMSGTGFLLTVTDILTTLAVVVLR